MGKAKGKKGFRKESVCDVDDDVLLNAAIAANGPQDVAMLIVAKNDQLAKGGFLNSAEQKSALLFKQAATRTLIPGQPMPKEITNALQRALEDIEREDMQKLHPSCGGEVRRAQGEVERPFANSPPTAHNDQQVLLRQKKMLDRMRKKQIENAEQRMLADIDPEEAPNCKRYNITVRQLRAIRRVGLSLPHECREKQEAELEAVAMKEEEDEFGDEETSLEDMFACLRGDDKFMRGMEKQTLLQ